jgi:nitroreductase
LVVSGFVNYSYAAPLPGNIIFTEVMANPEFGSEWFEIYNTTENVMNLHGCVISDGGKTKHVLEIQEDLFVNPFSFFVFAGGDFPFACSYQPDYSYSNSKLNLSASGFEELAMHCPYENSIVENVEDQFMSFPLIDRISWDADVMKIEKGSSIELCQGYFSSKENDSIIGWKSSSKSMCSTVSGTEFGTPGYFLQCESMEHKMPSAGSLKITEIMVTPAKGSIEWFEIYNRDENPYYLRGCSIVKSSTEGKTRYMINTEGKTVIEPYSFFVFSRDACIDFLCELSDYIYSGFSFPDTEEGTLSIECLDQENNLYKVDSILYNYGGKPVTEKGYSLSLKPEFIDLYGEFDPLNFCAASKDSSFIDRNGIENFGTPGSFNSCGEDIMEQESFEAGNIPASCTFSFHGNMISFAAVSFIVLLFLGCLGRNGQEKKSIISSANAEISKGENMSFEKVMDSRKSTRKFLQKPVEKEKLDKIIERINSAPSAGNLQAYKVYVVQSDSMKKDLTAAAWGQNFIAEAPVCLVFFADPKASAKKYGTRGENLYSVQDATIAAVFGWLEAVNQGLSGAWVGAFDDSAVSSAAGASPDLKPVAIIPVGYAGETPYKTGRKKLEEIIKFVK